jgi:hypothetical protein
MNEQFTKFYFMLKELRENSSSKEKVNILKRYNCKSVKELLFLALDYRFVYNLKKLPKPTENNKGSDNEIRSFLYTLSTQTGTKKKEAQELANLCSDKKVRYVVECILEKDLKCGVNVKLINKAFGAGTIKEHSPMLCYYAARFNSRKKKFSEDLDIFIKKCGGWKKGVFGSKKENGVRIWADIFGKFVSRNGIDFPNFGAFHPDVKLCIEKIAKDFKMAEEDIIIDGEMITIDEDFQKQMTQVRRLKEADPSIFILKIFDFIGPDISFKEKVEYMEEVLQPLLKKYKVKKTMILPHNIFYSFEEFKKYFLNIVGIGGEGVVLKSLDSVYENKRSSFWCKVKNFFSGDFKVVGHTISTKGKNKGLLKALTISYKGVTTDVGSGYSEKERKEFLKKQPKLIEVEYFCVTKDGKLFHPTFKLVREDKDEESLK